ncbi:MAG: hypothetical protein ABI672_03140 [Vicinamibacteria bacterium]
MCFIGAFTMLSTRSSAQEVSPAATSTPTPSPSPTPREQIELRRPGQSEPLTYDLPPIDPARVSPPEAVLPRESLPVTDRWRIMETLGLVKQRFGDPYNQNVFKGDKPYEPFRKWGDDVFLNLVGVSDTLVEARRLPIPVGAQSSRRDGTLDVFAPSNQLTLAQTLIFGGSIIKGNTTFKPPEYEYRLILAANLNRSQVDPVRALRVDPGRGFVRYDGHIAVVEAFYDKHRRNVSDRYDFDSYRVGLQPMISDFRGFIFQDNALGIRYFGNRDNNRRQYNLAALVRMEKDTNSGLIDALQHPRADFVLLANLYKQDFPRHGYTTQFTVINNWNLENGDAYYNKNGFQERPAVLGDARPHRYNVTYLGANGDGHFGVWNLTSSLYGVVGRDSRNPLAERPQTVAAAFFATELSRDFDWVRGRFTLIGATGDSNPFDGKATGFDAIQENPQIAGADTGFWIRQAVPLIGGGGVAISGRNGVLPSLRSSKDQGQSNFVNPGLMFAGLGADLDVKPQVRVITNASAIGFANTSVLSVLRGQGKLGRFAGIDLSTALQIRPLMTQNIVLNVSGAVLLPGRSFKLLYDENRRGPQYSILMNVVLAY